MTATTTTTTTSVSVVGYYWVAAAATTTALLCGIWIPLARWKWQHRIANFIQTNDNDNNKDNNDNNAEKKKKKMLLVVNPASGGGKTMKYYPQVRDELKSLGWNLFVFVTKSSDDMKSILSSSFGETTIAATTTSRSTQLKLHDFQALAIMGGDSSLTELVQSTLAAHGGIWPTHYPPILHIPTGSGNAIATEMFGHKTSISKILQHGIQDYKRASVMSISATNNNNNNNIPTRYALHNAFDGVQRHIINVLESTREHLYPAFGELLLLPLVIWSIFTYNPQRLKNKSLFPYFCALLTDYEGKGINLGFGLNRFDDQMVILCIHQWPGAWLVLRHVIVGIMSGELAKQHSNDALPNFITIEKTSNYKLSLQQHKQYFNFYFDGTAGTLPFCGSSNEATDIEIKVIPNAIPYFYMKDRSDNQDTKKQ